MVLKISPSPKQSIPLSNCGMGVPPVPLKLWDGRPARPLSLVWDGRPARKRVFPQPATHSSAFGQSHAAERPDRP
ncbi:hypothetical protein QUB36_15375 [Microcoleus sp. AT8-B1]|uniref:hypothetical protein n=1 Tax=unclassified Microcoleus TaxID=2642155 RepID=UPI002FD1B121